MRRGTARPFLVFEADCDRPLLRLLATGTDLLAPTGMQPAYDVLSSTAIAITQTVALDAGHVVAVIAAHDRALRLYANRAIASQCTDAATDDHLRDRRARAAIPKLSSRRRSHAYKQAQ